MIEDIFLDEEYLEDCIKYSVVESVNSNTLRSTYGGGPLVHVERRTPKIFIFDFEHEEGMDGRFSIACYTLDEALHTFLNMYKDVVEFKVTVKL